MRIVSGVVTVSARHSRKLRRQNAEGGTPTRAPSAKSDAQGVRSIFIAKRALERFRHRFRRRARLDLRRCKFSGAQHLAAAGNQS